MRKDEGEGEEKALFRNCVRESLSLQLWYKGKTERPISLKAPSSRNYSEAAFCLVAKPPRFLPGNQTPASLLKNPSKIWGHDLCRS